MSRNFTAGAILGFITGLVAGALWAWLVKCHGLTVGAILGFITSLVAGALWAWSVKCHTACALRRDYSPIAGEYTAYIFKKNGVEETSVLDYSAPSATATIKYKQRNILHLEMRETAHKNIWSGMVSMETPTYGTVTWKYDEMSGQRPPADHRFGFKRCIFTTRYGADRRLHDYLYLINDDEKAYTREALEKSGGLKGTQLLSNS